MLGIILIIIAIVILLMLFFQGSVITTAKNLNPIYKTPPEDIGNLSNTELLDIKYSKITYQLSSLGEPCKVGNQESVREFVNLPYNYSVQGCKEGLKCIEGIFKDSGICQADLLNFCNSSIDCSNGRSCLNNKCQNFCLNDDCSNLTDKVAGFTNSECLPGVKECPGGYSCNKDENLCKIFPEYGINYKCNNDSECYNISETFNSTCVDNMCLESVPDGISLAQANKRSCVEGSEFVNGFCQDKTKVDKDGKILSGGACIYQSNDQVCVSGLKCLFWKDIYDEIKNHRDDKINILKDTIGICGNDVIDVGGECSAVNNCNKNLVCEFDIVKNKNLCRYDYNVNICKTGTCTSDSLTCKDGNCLMKVDGPCTTNSDCLSDNCDLDNPILYVHNYGEWEELYTLRKNQDYPSYYTDKGLKSVKISTSKESLLTLVNPYDNKKYYYNYIIYHQFDGDTKVMLDTEGLLNAVTFVYYDPFNNNITISRTIYIEIENTIVTKLLDVKTDAKGVINVFYSCLYDSKYYIFFSPLSYTGSYVPITAENVFNIYNDTSFLLKTPDINEDLNKLNIFYVTQDIVTTQRNYDFYFEFCGSSYKTPKLAASQIATQDSSNIWNAVIITCVILGETVADNKTIVNYTFYKNFSYAGLVTSNYLQPYPEKDFYVFNRKIFTSIKGLPSGPCFENLSKPSPNNFTYNFYAPKEGGGHTEYNMNIINEDTNAPVWTNYDSAINFTDGINNCYAGVYHDYLSDITYRNYDNILTDAYECGNITSFSNKIDYDLNVDINILSEINSYTPNSYSYSDIDNFYILTTKLNEKNVILVVEKINDKLLPYKSLWLNYEDPSTTSFTPSRMVGFAKYGVNYPSLSYNPVTIFGKCKA